MVVWGANPSSDEGWEAVADLPLESSNMPAVFYCKPLSQFPHEC
jgi:hypothetical protein